MFPHHQHYVDTLSERLIIWLRRKSRSLPDAWLDAALVLLHLDLEPARPTLQALYSPNPRGRTPRDPIRMLRAFLLMLLLREDSIPRFADTLRHTPRLAHIAGFPPHDTPAVGTFYLFLDRLEDGPYQKPCQHRIRPSTLRKGKHRRHLPSEKEQRHLDAQKDSVQYDSVTQKLTTELLAAKDQPRPRDLQQRLEDILIECAILPSAQRGLLGDLAHLTICGDGSALVSGANPYGTPTCTCHKEGIYRCDHDRIYTDPTADWGYDSYRDTYYFGHTFYQHVVATQGHDLPLHVGIGPASETDFTLSLNSLDRLRKALNEHGLHGKIDTAIYDAGHDAHGIYAYLGAAHITPAIPLNARSATQTNPSGTAQRINPDGVPVCPAGLLMRRHCHNTHNHRIYFNCPVKRPTRRNGHYTWIPHQDECPHQTLCQPHTRMGPVVYVRSDDDPRLYPTIPRHSTHFKRLMNLRSGCERSNAVKKDVYLLGKRPCRNATHFLIRLYFASLLEHAKAWLAEERKRLGNDPCTLIRSAQQQRNLQPQQHPERIPA